MAKSPYVHDHPKWDDDDEILRDGAKRTVPMMMRDALAEYSERFPAKRFGLADSSSLHRPGPRYNTDAAARAHVEEVYQDEKRKLMDAWRQPVAADAQEGDVCTVREGGVDEGSPGHLRMVKGELVCVPDKRRQDSAPSGPVYDAVEGQRIKDQAYREMVDELINAWRNKPVPSSIEPTDAVPRAMTADEAQAIKDAAYAEMCRDLEQAWKR
jgi:hypothetical protein